MLYIIYTRNENNEGKKMCRNYSACSTTKLEGNNIKPSRSNLEFHNISMSEGLENVIEWQSHWGVRVKHPQATKYITGQNLLNCHLKKYIY
jgi:hypothetical protein